MDGVSISAQHLYARLGTAAAPIIIDVRGGKAFAADGTMIVGAVYRAFETVKIWRADLPKHRDVAVYCVNGGEVSQGVAEALQAAGIRVAFVEAGIAAWKQVGLPTRRKRDRSENKWVTREHPKIDRIACPWLISRFVNPDAEFI